MSIFYLHRVRKLHWLVIHCETLNSSLYLPHRSLSHKTYQNSPNLIVLRYIINDDYLDVIISDTFGDENALTTSKRTKGLARWGWYFGPIINKKAVYTSILIIKKCGRKKYCSYIQYISKSWHHLLVSSHRKSHDP